MAPTWAISTIATVEADRPAGEGARRSAVRLEFDPTVGGLVAAEPYWGYRADRFQFRVRPPATCEGRLAYDLRAEPPRGGREGLGV